MRHSRVLIFACAVSTWSQTIAGHDDADLNLRAPHSRVGRALSSLSSLLSLSGAGHAAHSGHHSAHRSNASSFDPSHLVADDGARHGGMCLDWDLAAPAVPDAVAFRFPRTPGFVSFDGSPADALSFWKRVDEGNAKAGKQSLHAALGLTGTATAAVADALRAKRQELRAAAATAAAAAAAAGGSTVPAGPGGIFVLLRGDSHLRIILSMLIMTMSGDPEVIEMAK